MRKLFRTISLISLALLLALGLSLATTRVALAEDTTAPTIIKDSCTVAADNSYIDVVFSEGVYSTSGGSGALDADDFTLTFAPSGGTATDVTIASVKKTTGEALTGGESTIRVMLNIIPDTYTPNGQEKFKVKVKDAISIYDEAGNAASASETTGFKYLKDKAPPTVTSATPTSLADADEGSVPVTITFSEAMDPNINPSPTIKGLTDPPYIITGNDWSKGDTEWKGSFDFEDNNKEKTGKYHIKEFQDAAGNIMTADNKNEVDVDTLNPGNQDTVFAASVSQKGGADVTIVSSGDATNNVWFAPSGTTSFIEGSQKTKAGGTATTIKAPADKGDYHLFVIDAAGNCSAESTAILTVDNTSPGNQDTVFAASVSQKGGADVTIVSSGDATNNVWFAPSGTTSFIEGSQKTKAGGTATTIKAPADKGDYHLFVIDAAGNCSAESTAILTVDNTSPGNQDTVFAASVSQKGGADVTIVSSGDATNNVWFAPSGTTSFIEGSQKTKAGGTATTIKAPADKGDYHLFVIDAAGNCSAESTAILTVDNTSPGNQDTVFAASVSQKGGADVTIVSSGDATNNVWFAPSGTTSFTEGSQKTKAGGTATTIKAPADKGDYHLFVIDAAGNCSAESTAILTVDNTSPGNQDTVFAASVSQKGGADVTIVSSGDATNNVWFAPSGTTSFTEGSQKTKAGGTATTIKAPADEGAYHLFVIDAAGNYSAESTAILTVDNTMAGSPSTIELGASKLNIPANGSSTSTITTVVSDEDGNPVADGTSVAFTTSLGTITSPHTTSGGVATVTLTSGTTSGTAAVKATVNGVSSTIYITFTSGAPSVITIGLTADPKSIVANGSSTSTITAVVSDEEGNPVADGTEVSFITTLGTITTSSTTTNGVAKAILTSGASSGTATISVSSNGVSSTTQVDITADVVEEEVTETISGGETDSVEGPAESDTTVTVTTTAEVEVTITNYTDNPHPEAASPMDSLDKYCDVSVSNPDAISWPIRVEVSYTDDEIAAKGLIEESLKLYYFKDGAWHECSDTGVDTINNIVWAEMTKEEASGSPVDAKGSYYTTQFLEIDKSVDASTAVTGDIITYTVKLTNISTHDEALDIEISDKLPFGIVYISGSTAINGVLTSDPSGSNPFSWCIDVIAAESTATITYKCAIGLNTVAGFHDNEATIKSYSVDGITLALDPPRAMARVKVVVFETKGIIIGKVFEDLNGDGWQDKGEPGIPGIDIVMEDGTTVTTDVDGKYSIPGVEPGYHVLTIDEATLPEGYEILGEVSKFVEVPEVGMAKLNSTVVKQQEGEAKRDPG